MGFLKFLKRDKKAEVNELDLPPEPPFGDFDDKMSDFPELPEINAENVNNDFKLDYPQEQKPSTPVKEFAFPKFADRGADLPMFPEMEQMEEPIATSPLEKPAAQAPNAYQPTPKQNEKPEIQQPEAGYPRPGRLFHHEKKTLERPSRKEIYVRIDKFKATLDGISAIRNNLRMSEESLMRLENIKNSQDRSFDRVKSCLDDLQKRLIFIDETLFKGD